MADHDHAYKLLFSHPEMVRDLLEGFVNEPWLEQLDYGSLERVPSTYVSDDLRERSDDVVWRSQAQVLEVVRSLLQWLTQPEQDSLRRAFVVWIKRVILGRTPGAAVERVEDLETMGTLLEARMKQWEQEWLRQGEARMLQHQLQRRFGELPSWVSARLSEAEPEQLERWAERLLEVESLTALFGSDAI